MQFTATLPVIGMDIAKHVFQLHVPLIERSAFAGALIVEYSVDALVRHQVVLRGLANGQRVPEDWQAPDAAALVRLSMGAQTRAAHDPVADDMAYYFAQASGRGISLGGAHV